MEQDFLQPARFHRYVQLIDGIQKCIHKLRIENAPGLGVKSVHVFWLHSLLSYPDGLTAAELAAKSMVDRSLISREIADLYRRGYVTLGEGGGDKRKNYNARIRLTEAGVDLARRIHALAMSVQEKIDVGISEEELISFYATLEKMHRNFLSITDESDTGNAERP